MCLVTYSVQLFSLLIQQYLFCWNPIDSKQHVDFYLLWGDTMSTCTVYLKDEYIEGLPMGTATMQQIKPNGKLYNLI